MPYRIILAVSAAFLSASAFWMFLPLLSISLRSDGVGDVWVGFISGLPWVGLLAMSGFIQIIIRRFGLQRMVLFGMAAAVFIFLGFAIGHDLLFSSLLCLAMGGALALRWVGMDTWVNSSFPAHLRGRLTGLYELILSGSMAVGPGILAVSGGSGRGPFVAGAAVTAAAAILLSFAGREPLHNVQQEAQPMRRRQILAHRPAAFIGIFLVGFTEAGNLSLLPVLGLSQGFSTHFSELLVTLVQSGVALGAALVGGLSDHFAHQKLRNATILGMVLVPFVLTLDMQAGLWPWLFVWGLAQGGLFTLGIVWLASRHTGLDLASAMSLSMVIYTVGGIMGPPVLGICMSLMGPKGFTSGLVLFACFCALAIYKCRSSAATP